MTTKTDYRSKCFKQSFAATLENIDVACEKAKAYLTDIGLEQMSFEVILLTREMLVNAVIHGSGLDKGKQVELGMYLNTEKQELVIEVEDQGEGFDWQSQLNAKADLSDESGRGFEILKVYSDNFKYDRNGNKLTVCKSVNGQ